MHELIGAIRPVELVGLGKVRRVELWDEDFVLWGFQLDPTSDKPLEEWLPFPFEGRNNFKIFRSEY